MDIDYSITDRADRLVTLTEITDDNWGDVADVAPSDDQRGFVPPSAARYLLLSMREGVWSSLAVCANGEVVGHVMWGWDEDDQKYWIGGLVVDAPEQGKGIGKAAMKVLLRWLLERPDCDGVRLSYETTNIAARRLYESLGFRELDEFVDDEVVAELDGYDARRVLGTD